MKDCCVAILGIMVEDGAPIGEIQKTLSENCEYIIGRMGIPHCEKNVRVISVVLDAPVDKVEELTKKFDSMPNVHAKNLYSIV